MGSRPERLTRSPLPSLVRCEHELGARGCGYRQWERGARAQRRRFCGSFIRASRVRTLHLAAPPSRPTAAAHKERGGGRGNAPARGRCMHAPDDMRGGSSKGQNHCQGQKLPRAWLRPKCCCVAATHMYASCPNTALDAFFFQKNVRRYTPIPPPPPSGPYCTAIRRTHPPTPLFLKRDPPHDRGSRTRHKFSLWEPPIGLFRGASIQN